MKVYSWCCSCSRSMCAFLAKVFGHTEQDWSQLQQATDDEEQVGGIDEATNVVSRSTKTTVPPSNQALEHLLGAVVRHLNETLGFGQWENCEIDTRMRCDQLAVRTTVCSNDDTTTGAGGKMTASTPATKEVVPDHQTSRIIAAAVAIMWSQRGMPGKGTHRSAIRFRISNQGKATIHIDAADEAKDVADEDDLLLDKVYRERSELYARKFRNGEPMSDQIIKMRNFFVVWPMGGLVKFQSSSLNNCHVTITTGLSNPDMPAKLKSVPAASAGRFLLVHKDVTPLPRVGMAGYGYEMLILTREPAQWPMFTLNWACDSELLRDIEFLGRVEALGAITIGQVPAGDGRLVNVLIAPAKHLTPEVLSNGRIQFLIMTVITNDELDYRMQHGTAELLDLLYDKGVGQVSDLDRTSVI